MTLEEQIAQDLGCEITKEIDTDVLWTLMGHLGWVRVVLSRLTDNNHAIDITLWLEQNCQYKYQRNGREFIFEDPREASLFSLRWL